MRVERVQEFLLWLRGFLCTPVNADVLMGDRSVGRGLMAPNLVSGGRLVKKVFSISRSFRTSTFLGVKTLIFEGM